MLHQRNVVQELRKEGKKKERNNAGPSGRLCGHVPRVLSRLFTSLQWCGTLIWFRTNATDRLARWVARDMGCLFCRSSAVISDSIYYVLARATEYRSGTVIRYWNSNEIAVVARDFRVYATGYLHVWNSWISYWMNILQRNCFGHHSFTLYFYLIYESNKR